MADPLAVAGLAAGLVSLGLQVCGGVTQYVDALDCREQDIASVRQQNVSLQKTLHVVETSLAQLEHDHRTATTAVHNCIDGCKNELKTLLSLMADLDVNCTQSATNRRDKIRNQSKKLLYPFSRPKLEQLETRLRNANATLQLALQALGLSVSQLAAEKLAGLESTSRNTSASLLVVQSDISAMRTPLQGINSSFSEIYRRFDGLEQLVTQFLVHSPAITPEVVTTWSRRKPRVSKNACTTNDVRTRNPSSQLVSAASGQEQFQNLVSSFLGGAGNWKCICPLSPVLKRRDFVYGPLGFFLETAARNHLPECPAARITGPDRSRTIGLKYIGLRRLLNSTIQLSFAMKSGAGAWGISPNLTYYPTVDPEIAPAFRILVLLRRSLFWSQSASHLLLPQWEKLIALALAKILNLFQARKASPFAVNSTNQSLAHVAAECIKYTLDHTKGQLAQLFIELLRCLIVHKVPATDYDLFGNSPLGTMISSFYYPTSQSVDAAILILQSNSEITPAHLSQAPPPWPWTGYEEEELSGHGTVNRTIRFLGCSAQIAEAYGCGPLGLAVLANDSAQVEVLLQHYPSTLSERNLLRQTPLHLAVGKPSCLRLLVRVADDKLLNAIDNSGTTALEIAVFLSGAQCKEGRSRRRCRRCHCTQSAALLIKAGCTLPVPGDLQSLLDKASHRCKLRYIRAIRCRRERLKQLALAKLSSTEADRLRLLGGGVLDSHASEVIELLGRRGVQIPEALGCLSIAGTRTGLSVYHKLTNSEDADLFFRLRFLDMDFGLHDYAYLRLTHGADLSLSYLHWFAEHGVDILCQPLKTFEAGGGIVTAHFTFASIGRAISVVPSEYDHFVLWIQELGAATLSNGLLDIADNCQCKCWLGGCTPLTSLLKPISYYVGTFHGVYFESMGKVIAIEFSKYLESCGYNLGPKRHSAALRFLTFAALGIRHTCCKLTMSGQNCGDECEAEDECDAEDEQAYELALLEELLEEFEREVAMCFQNPDGSVELLVGFWKNTWVSRMTEVRAAHQGNALSDDERRRAEEIGVVWDRPAPEEVTENPYSKSTVDYWLYELDKIEVD